MPPLPETTKRRSTLDTPFDTGSTGNNPGSRQAATIAYDEATGVQQDDWQTYARIIEGIRARAVVNSSSVNFRRFDAERRQESGFVYLNPDEHIDEFAWGFPPREYALDAYLSLLNEVGLAS